MVVQVPVIAWNAGLADYPRGAQRRMDDQCAEGAGEHPDESLGSLVHDGGWRVRRTESRGGQGDFRIPFNPSLSPFRDVTETPATVVVKTRFSECKALHGPKSAPSGAREPERCLRSFQSDTRLRPPLQCVTIYQKASRQVIWASFWCIPMSLGSLLIAWS